MSDAGLRIVIGADIKAAVAGVQQLDDSLETLEKDLARIDFAITNALAAGRDTTALEADFESVRQKVVALRAEAAKPILVPPIPPIPVPDDKPFLNTIAKQRTAFIDLGRVVTGQGFNLRSLASNFTLFGPAITIAAAAIYGLIEVFKSQSKEAEEAAKVNKQYLSTFGKAPTVDITQAKAQLEAYNKIVDDSVSSAGKETAQIDILVNRLQQGNLTRGQTVEVIKKLQQIAPDYFSKLNAEKASIDDVTTAYGKYNQALIQNLEAQIHIAEITDLVKKRLDFSRQTPDAAKFINDQIAAGKSLDDISKQINLETSKGLSLSEQAALANKANSGELQKQALLNSKIPFGTQTILEFLREEQDLLKEISNAPLKLEGIDDKTGKEKDTLLSSILEKIRKINEEIAKPSKDPIFKQLLDANSAADIKTPGSIGTVLQAQISEAIDNAAKDPKHAQAYKALADAIGRELDHIKNFSGTSHVQGIVDVTADDLSKVQSKIEKAIGTKGLDIKVPIHISQLIENTGAFGKDDVAKIKEEIEKTPGLSNLFQIAVPSVQISIGKFLIHEADIKKLKETIQEVGSSVVISGFADVGKALGDALSGSKNPLQTAIKDFTSILGDGLIKIGEQMILASTLMATIRAALSTLFNNPIGGVVAGIAAVALGEIVKNVGAHAFADGGIVTGPTNALIGEAGPEVVFPLNQLNRFIQRTNGGGTQNINVTGSISGNNIRLAMARSNKQQGLV